MIEIALPGRDGSLETYRLGTHPTPTTAIGPCESRVLYAAAHVVADPLGDPVGTTAIDWDATLAFRHHLWDIGFGVAEAMDTAQRGMGLSLDAVRELITRSLVEAPERPGAIVCGINTDDLTGGGHTIDAIVASYLDQLEFVSSRGGAAVMMASRALAASATDRSEYAAVYRAVLSHASQPVVIHWLGPMFDPALAGYWGTDDPYEAMRRLVDVVCENADHIDGVKVSMLDAELEIEFRALLPEGVRCYTGDDFNFPTLIEGDATHHSDGLLGIFDAIAPVAMTAHRALDNGDSEEYHRLLGPTVPMSRHIFETPTLHYKTGLTFLAYLNGHQDHFRMIGGQESARSIIHLAELVRLADVAGLLPDTESVVARLYPVLTTAGVL